MYDKVVVEIVEQPASVNERFRYKSERQATILGVKSDGHFRTYPAIRVLNYTGEAVVVVSCVTPDSPYRQHPNALTGRSCSKGLCKIEFDTDETEPTVVTFKNIGIQCCKKTEIVAVLTERELLRVDPFLAKFTHKWFEIDFNAVRLCFQVVLKTASKLHPITPVVSDIIYDKKTVSDLKIRDISDTSSPSIGGKKIMIFCDRVMKHDIKIRFYREDIEDKSVKWEAWGHFDKNNVHHQCAIAFKTPAYETLDIDEPVNVFVQLVKPSNGSRSKPQYFQYVPDYSNINQSVKNKKRKLEESESLFQHAQQGWEEDRGNIIGMEKRIKTNIQLNAVASSLAPTAETISNTTEIGRVEPATSVTQSNFLCNGAVGYNPVASSLAPTAETISNTTEIGRVEPATSVTQSNFSCDGAVGYNPVESNQLQQLHFNNQRFPQNFYPQNNSETLSNQCCFNQQGQQSQSHFPQSQHNQPYHNYTQYSQMHPQYYQYPQCQQYTEVETHPGYQSLDYLTKPLADNTLNMPNELQQLQSQFNVCHADVQPQQHGPQQQYFPQ